MLKVIKIVFGIALLAVVLGTLGMSIASLVTVLNIQDTLNAQFNSPETTVPANPTTSTTTKPTRPISQHSTTDFLPDLSTTDSSPDANPVTEPTRSTRRSTGTTAKPTPPVPAIGTTTQHLPDDKTSTNTERPPDDAHTTSNLPATTSHPATDDQPDDHTTTDTAADHTTSPPIDLVSTTEKDSIPELEVISEDDPRYGAYKGFSQLLSTWMNRTVDPCDDFYEYTCGAGEKGQPMSFDISDDEMTESMVGQLRQDATHFKDSPLPVRQLKWFYDACREYTSPYDFATQARRIFNDMKTANPDFGFPALYPTETHAATPVQLAAFLGYTLGTNGITTLVDVNVDSDWKDPHNSKGGYAFYLYEPATLYVSTYYTKTYYREDVVEYLVDTINAAAQLLNIDIDDQQQVRKDAEDMADFDYALATKYSPSESRSQYENLYNPYTVDGLQQLAPFIDWKTFFNRGLVTISKTVDGSFRSVVTDVDLLALLSADIVSGKIASRTINNYLYIVALTNSYLPDVSSLHKKHAHLLELRRDRRRFKRNIRREPRIEPLDIVTSNDFTNNEGYCQYWSNNYLSWASTRLYVDTNYATSEEKQAIREQANSIIRSVLAAFRAQIDLLDWMSPASKKGAYKKIDNIVVNILFPDWVLDDEKLTAYYQKLDTAENDNYIQQLDKLNTFGIYEFLAPLLTDGPADRTAFSGTPVVTNAWYSPWVNSITLAGGILLQPFYDNDYPASVNYGGLAVIAGHELTHGFDDQGVQWEGTGILNSWMDANSTKEFTKMAQCVVNEYSQFCPLVDGNPCVDGDQTQGENIADNGGMQAAYKAFKAYEALHGPDPLLPGDASRFTADQLFFISFAQVWCQYPPSATSLLNQILKDTHSPSLYRVLGTLQNIPAFQKAFNCPIDSVYAPSNHCNVWTSEPTSGAPLNAKGEPIVPDNDVNIAPVERISPQNMDKYSAYQNALATFKSSANLDVDPCDDFYHYSCGAYPGAKTTFYDLDQVNIRVINDKLNAVDYQATIQASTALGKLKTLYDSCKAEAAHSTIDTTNYLQPKVLKFRNYINQDIPLIGGTGKVDVSPEDYGSVLGYLSFQLGIDTLVTPMVDTNWIDPQAEAPNTKNGYQLFVDQSTTYHVRAFYEDDNWEKQNQAYKSTVKALVEAYAKQDKTATLPADYENMIDEALEMEKMIAITYSGTDEERRSYMRQWIPKQLADLSTAVTAVDWNKYFAFAPREAQDWITTDDIIINELTKTTALFAELRNKYDATVVNYLFIRLLLANSGLIPCFNEKCAAVMGELAVKKMPEHTGKSRIPGRRHPLPSFRPLNDEDYDGIGCADEVSVMDDAQGRVYIDARFPTENDRNTIRAKTMGVMTNIVNAMKGMIMDLDWMDSVSKNNALNKASNIKVNVAFPDYILDDNMLDSKYADLTFAKDESYYSMLDKITVYSINQQYKLLTLAKADRSDFLGQTAVVNAWYEPALNSITFPAGILQAPFFDVNYPAGLNYGGMGVVAGHELTHGFDDEGVQWDFDGRLNSWMTQPSQDGFNAMAQCVIDEYGQFCPLPDDRSPHCTDGVRTQGENIADNGGIHSAWRAYEAHIELDGPDALFMDRVYSQYTEHQLYFLNFAQVWCIQKNYLTESYVSGRLMTDPHSLGPYRVLGTLQNIPAFQANFNCPRGSTYAPEQHCAVWVPTVMA